MEFAIDFFNPFLILITIFSGLIKESTNKYFSIGGSEVVENYVIFFAINPSLIVKKIMVLRQYICNKVLTDTMGRKLLGQLNKVFLKVVIKLLNPSSYHHHTDHFPLTKVSQTNSGTRGTHPCPPGGDAPWDKPRMWGDLHMIRYRY